MISPWQRPLPNNTQHSQQTNIHAPGGIRAHDRSRRAAVDLRIRPRGQWDRRRCIRIQNLLQRGCELADGKCLGTAHHLCILYNQRDATYTMFFIIIISALHVSGGFSAHHQELIKLDVDGLGRNCNPSTPAADSRKA